MTRTAAQTNFAKLLTQKAIAPESVSTCASPLSVLALESLKCTSSGGEGPLAPARIPRGHQLSAMQVRCTPTNQADPAATVTQSSALSIPAVTTIRPTMFPAGSDLLTFSHRCATHLQWPSRWAGSRWMAPALETPPSKPRAAEGRPSANVETLQTLPLQQPLYTLRACAPSLHLPVHISIKPCFANSSQEALSRSDRRRLL